MERLEHPLHDQRPHQAPSQAIASNACPPCRYHGSLSHTTGRQRWNEGIWHRDEGRVEVGVIEDTVYGGKGREGVGMRVGKERAGERGGGRGVEEGNRGCEIRDFFLDLRVGVSQLAKGRNKHGELRSRAILPRTNPHHQQTPHLHTYIHPSPSFLHQPHLNPLPSHSPPINQLIPSTHQ